MTKNSKHELWPAWGAMHSRCNNPNSTCYHNYGGRGIRVCGRWYSFEIFLADMGERPQGMTLDRINNNGNYEPENCRWVTHKEQCSNTRRSVFLEINGERRTVTQWMEYLNASRCTVMKIADGRFTIEQALRGEKPEREKSAHHIRKGLTLNGETLSITEWASRVGITKWAITLRLRRGWTVAEVLGAEQAPETIKREKHKKRKPKSNPLRTPKLQEQKYPTITLFSSSMQPEFLAFEAKDNMLILTQRSNAPNYIEENG